MVYVNQKFIDQTKNWEENHRNIKLIPETFDYIYE